MGRRRRDQDVMDGVLVVDKPAGMTSHDVVQVVRRAAGQRRVGHTGTLDPDATGVLVVCLGRATRLVRFLQEGRKTYAARMVLGVATSTQDASGDLLSETSAAGIDEHALCEALTRFVGDIEQIPPMVSALKVDGVRLHELARRGEEVERAPRPVTVHDLVLEGFTPGERAEASFLITCSPGTYVRTIAHDVGADLGVGGSLLELRRIGNAGFTETDAVPLDEVRSRGEAGTLTEVVRSLRQSVTALPVVDIDDEEILAGLVHGRGVPAQGIEGPYAVVAGERVMGIYADHGGLGRPEVVLAQQQDTAQQQDAAATDAS